MTNLIIFVLLAINIFAFVYVGVDKKKSIQGSERFSEGSFFFLAVFFASLGVLLGMFTFRHKTRKVHFVLGMALLLFQQGLLAGYILNLI